MLNLTCLSNILIEDTRQQVGKHDNIAKYCEEKGIHIIRKTLLVGDYMLGAYENFEFRPIGNTSVDTKKDRAELANDLYRDKLAFNKKYKKCYEQGIKLIVLIEEPITTMSELLSWSSPHTKINGKSLFDMMQTLKVSYGIKFIFCDKKDTGMMIMNLLMGE